MLRWSWCQRQGWSSRGSHLTPSKTRPLSRGRKPRQAASRSSLPQRWWQHSCLSWRGSQHTPGAKFLASPPHRHVWLSWQMAWWWESPRWTVGNPEAIWCTICRRWKQLKKEETAQHMVGPWCKSRVWSQWLSAPAISKPNLLGANKHIVWVSKLLFHYLLRDLMGCIWSVRIIYMNMIIHVRWIPFYGGIILALANKSHGWNEQLFQNCTLLTSSFFFPHCVLQALEMNPVAWKIRTNRKAKIIKRQ